MECAGQVLNVGSSAVHVQGATSTCRKRGSNTYLRVLRRDTPLPPAACAA